ncbi:MAG: hypothetical protein OEZ39_16580 [Gammaproteobacteria bacterium]|nr:hypothetical protein [Gammaproteobacteria bacterium]MDH5653477.1 hypothetical protein [Gammaproteobacteria bacterium]
MKPRLIYLMSLLLLIPLLDAMAAEQAAPEESGDKETRVYRKFNPDGVVEFSDSPKHGGEAIQLEKLPTYKQAPPPKSVYTPRKRKTKQETPAGPYHSIVITQPADDSAVRENSGLVRVTVRLEPALQKGGRHRIQYYIDNKPVATGGISVSIPNVDRGTHSLQAKVVDSSGRVFLESAQIKFHLLRYFKPQSRKSAPVTPVKTVDQGD